MELSPLIITFKTAIVSTYIFNAIVQSESEVYAIEFPTLHKYLEKKPLMAINLLKIIGIHMRKQHSKFRDIVLYGKKGAIYSTLIRLANSYGKEVDEGILIFIKDIEYLREEIECENCGKEICNIE